MSDLKAIAEQIAQEINDAVGDAMDELQLACTENVILSALRAAVDAQRQADAAMVPTSWLDPLLTGPDAVLGKPPYDCPDIERLLRAVKSRIAEAIEAWRDK